MSSTTHAKHVTVSAMALVLVSLTALTQGLAAGHLFGDIFGRDNLDWQSRELVVGWIALGEMIDGPPVPAAYSRNSSPGRASSRCSSTC